MGTAFFGSLAGGDYVAATRTGLVVGLALFGVALAACLVLPRGERVSAENSARRMATSG